MTSTTLPSNLQPGGGGALSITTTTFPDAINGRSYSLAISTTGGSGALSSCMVISGALPTGLSWSISTTNPSQCILSGASVGAAGTYSIVVQATDTTLKTDSLSYNLVVRNDFSICSGPSSALPAPYTTSCTATSPTSTTTSLPAAVQGRSYGVSPLSELIVTNLNTTADVSSVGHATEAGNGPFTSATTVMGLAPGIAATPSSGGFGLTSTAVGASSTYTVTVSVSDNPILISTQSQPVVPSRTYVKTYKLVVDSSLQLAQSLGTTWPNAVHGRAYGAGTGCSGGACTPAVYTASGGLGGYVWPASTPASISAITGMSCPAVAAGTTTYTCSAAAITAGSATPGAAAVSFSPSVTVTDAANTATPAATATTDPGSMATATLQVDSPLGSTLTQNGVTNPATLIPAVVNRSYGVIGAAPTYTAVGGLGSSTYGWCVSAGALPAGLGVVSASCATPTSSASLALTANPLTGAANTYAYTIELNDLGNATTPSSSASSTSGTIASTLVVNPALVAAVIQSSNATPATRLLDGVVNRSYGAVPTTLATAAPAIYSATGGLPTASGMYLWCISTGSLPPNLTGISAACGSATSTASSTAQLSASTIGGTGGAYTFTVQADDGGNAAVPSTFLVPAAGSMVGPTGLTVHPQITLAQSLGTSWPDAVYGRAYGSGLNCVGGSACSPAVYSATGGLGGYVWPAATPPSITGITGMSCATASGNYDCSAAAITAPPATAGTAAVSYSPSASVTDTANAATPAATLATDPNSTRTDTMWVDSPLLATLMQNGGTNPPNLLPGVSGRSYGTVGAAPTYTAAGGLGSRTVTTYEWCVSTPATLPTGFAGISATCATPTTGAASETLTSANITSAITPPSHDFSFTVELDDAGNTTTPASAPTSTSSLNSTALLVNAPLALALTQATNATPTTALLAGVTNRTYGLIGAPPTYTASYGLGGYVFPASPASYPAGFACSSATVNPYACVAGTALTAAPATYPLSVAVNDTSNPAVPAGTATATSSLVVNAQIQLAQSLGANWPDAVDGRAYGMGLDCVGGSACAPAIYSATGGLGTYVWPGSTPPSITGITGMSCAVSGVNYNCSATDITAPPTAAGAGALLYNPNATVTDTANAATPAATTVTDPSSTRTDAVWVDSPLQVTLTQAGVGTNPAALLPGVSQRSYAHPGSAPTYAAAGGLGSRTVGDYQWCVSTGTVTVPQGLVGISSICAAPTTGAPVETLTATNITQIVSAPPSTNFAFTVELDDTGNASTPSSVPTASNTSATNSTSLLINAPLSLALTQSTNATPTAALLPAVTNRSYGTIAAGAGAPTYTASYGLGGYVFPASPGPFATVAGFACASPILSVYNCSANTVTASAATYSGLSLTVTDTANGAVPQGSAIATTSLPVNAQIQLAQSLGTHWPDSVFGRPYGTGNGCTGLGGGCNPAVYTATNGLAGYVWPATTPVSIAAVTGLNCPAVAVGSSTYSCSSLSIAANPVTPGTPPVTYNPSVTVTDTANAATPAATTTTDPNSTRTDTLVSDPFLGLNLTQDTPAPQLNPATLLPAVVGRSYGTLNLGSAPTYAALGGLGAGTLGAAAYEWCVNGVATLPLGLTGIAQGGAGLHCSVFGPIGTSTAALSSTDITAAVTPPFQNFFFTVELDDTGNASSPSSLTIGSTGNATTLPVYAALTVGTNLPGAAPDAVINRSYGLSSATCAGGNPCTPIIFTVNNGLTPYTWNPITTSDTAAASVWPTGFACAATPTPSTTYTCSAALVATSVTAGGFTASAVVNDTGNYATPGGLLNTPLNLAVNKQLSVLGPSPSPISDAVTGRGYGTPAGSQDLTYTLATGEGSPPVSLAGTGFPAPIACATQTDNVDSAATLPCNSGNAAVTGATSTGTVTATDTASTTTPAATTLTDPNSQISSAATTEVTVDPELVIDNQSLDTPACGSAVAPCPLPNGQLDQPYSVLFSCQAPLNTGTCGGTGSPNNAAALYTWAASNNNITGTAFITAMPVSNPATVSGLFGVTFAGTPSATGTADTVTIGVADTGNVTTPSCTTATTCPSEVFSANILPSTAFVGDNASANVDVIDTHAGEPGAVSATIATGGAISNYPAASTNGTDVFVADPGVDKLFIINSSSQTVSTATGTAANPGDVAAVAVGPQAIPQSLITPDDVYAYIANPTTDNVQAIDANPASVTFGAVQATIALANGPYAPGASDLRIAPTFFVSSARVTHGYVLRPAGDEVCVFDAEPSSGTFLTQIAAANNPNGDNCISLNSAIDFGGGVTAHYIEVTPDGLYAFVSETDGATAGDLSIIDTNPNDGTSFETVIGHVGLSLLTPACNVPEEMRSSVDGQTVWVACSDSQQLVAIETAKINGAGPLPLTSFLTPSATDAPQDIAFRPDGAFGLATLSGTGNILPFSYIYSPAAGTAGTAFTGGSVTAPWGIDHVPNPVLHITTTALPPATNNMLYQASIVAAGPNRYYTFTDITPSSPGPTLALVGLTLNSYGVITGVPPTGASGNTYSFIIQVTDQSQPVNNVVVQTVTLHVN